MPIMKAYGYKKDSFDPLDHLYLPKLDMVDVASLPKKVSLRSKMGKAYNQSLLGSCTANAIGKHIEFLIRKNRGDLFIPSRLFIYWNERNMEGTVMDDAGAEIRDGIKSVGIEGVCQESDWPYLEDQFTVKPSNRAYANAMLHRAIKYQRVQIFGHGHEDMTWVQMKACLAAGFPFVYGFMVPESFEGPELAKSGIFIPEAGEQIVGGHAVIATGYDEEKAIASELGALETMNSWDVDWGEEGFFWAPKSFMTNKRLLTGVQANVSDSWTIRSET